MYLYFIYMLFFDGLGLGFGLNTLGLGLGMGDHSMLNIVCGIQHCKTPVSDKINYNKGNYEDFRKYINICWDKYFCNCTSDIDKMWNLFKSIIRVGINKFIPKVSKFDPWNKSTWIYP